MKKVLSVVLALALVLVMGVVSASAADLKLGSNFKGLDSFKSLTKTSSVKDVTGTKKSAAESTTCVTSEVVTEKIEAADDENGEDANAADTTAANKKTKIANTGDAGIAAVAAVAAASAAAFVVAKRK